MRKNILPLLCSAVLLCACSSPALAGELDARMTKIVKVFTRAAEKAGLAGTSLAVMPFKTDKKLAEQRVDYACGEILTNRFVEARSFRMVERAQLDTVLREQALGAGGVTESATAARLGKLAGARLVVMGSVSRLGEAYHMTSELVDAETGEIVASDVTEVESRVFDKDAGRYLALVPEYDALGLYVAAGYAVMNVKTLPPVTAGGGEVITPRNSASACRYFGVGARYFFTSRWMVDAAVMIEADYSGNDVVADSSIGTTYRFNNGIGGANARVIVSRMFPVSEKLKLHAGGGIISINEGDASSANTEIQTESPEAPILRGAVEWKPTPRVGLFLSGMFYLGTPVFKGVAIDNSVAGGRRLPIREFSFAKFHPELNLSIYF